MGKRNLIKKLEERQCVICGSMFQPLYYNKVCCSHKCSAVHAERKKFYWKEKRKAKMSTDTPQLVAKRVLITDEEQKKINESVANRYAVKLETKIYERGSEEFGRIAEEIMRNHKLL